MRVILAIITCAALVSLGCTGEEDQPCRSGSTKYYAEALSKRLSKNGVRHSIHPNRGICYAARNVADVEKAAREVDNYFYEVAGLFKDECEERAFTEWAKKEKLPFEVHNAKNSEGRPSGRLFNIYSLTEEDVPINKKKLWDDAPREAGCKKEAVK